MMMMMMQKKMNRMKVKMTHRLALLAASQKAKLAKPKPWQCQRPKWSRKRRHPSRCRFACHWGLGCVIYIDFNMYCVVDSTEFWPPSGLPSFYLIIGRHIASRQHGAAGSFWTWRQLKARLREIGKGEKKVSNFFFRFTASWMHMHLNGWKSCSLARPTGNQINAEVMLGPLLDVLAIICLVQQLVFSGLRHDPDSDDEMAQEDLCNELFGDYLSGATLP